MKKRIFGVFFLLMLILTGCSTEPIDKGIDATIEKIPYDNLQYNGETFTLENIRMYQEKDSSGYGYYATVVITFDKTSLSDENFYWLIENRDIDVSCYLDEGKNNIDFKSLSKLKSYYNDEKLVYIFTDFEKRKYDFEGTEISLYINLIQEEEYSYRKDDGTTGTLNKENKYRYYIFDDSDEKKIEINDISELSEEEEKMRQKGLKEEYDFQSNLLNSMINN